MSNSYIIDCLNVGLGKIQSGLSKLGEDSVFMDNIDNFILFFMTLTLIFSLFAGTDFIVIPAIFVIVATGFKLLFKREQKFEMRKYGAALLLYLGLCIFSTICSHAPALSVKGLAKILVYLCYYFSVFQYLKFNREKIVYFIFLIALFCTVESVYAIFQSHLGTIAGATWQDKSYLNPEEVIDRAYGSLRPFNPNLLGGYLVMGFSSVLALLGLSAAKSHYKTASVLGVAALVNLAAIAYTGCRGAYLGVFALLVMLAIIIGKLIWQNEQASEQIKKIYLWIVSSLIALGAAAVVLVPSIFNRVISIFMLRGDSSTSFRMNVYTSSLRMFFDNWVLGVGVGNQAFREVYGYYMKTGFDALSAYNIFLEVAVESGLYAFLCFAAFFIFILKDGFKLIFKTEDIQTKILLSCGFLAIVATVVHGMVDTIFFRPQLQFLFWIMVAILTTYLNDEANKQMQA